MLVFAVSSLHFPWNYVKIVSYRFLSFPFPSFFFVRSLPITNCSFCIRSKYRSLLTGLITSICHVLDDTRILRFLPVIVFFEVSEEINKKMIISELRIWELRFVRD